MIDYSKSMKRYYEIWQVNPYTWTDDKIITNIVDESSSINRDLDSDSLGSASINITHNIDECYIRIYMICEQNDTKTKESLGTFLVQEGGISYDGTIIKRSCNCYTPLIELKENKLPVGYFLPYGSNILSSVYDIMRNNMRGFVERPSHGYVTDALLNYNFVASDSDTYLSLVTDLLADAEYHLTMDVNGTTKIVKDTELKDDDTAYLYNSDSGVLYPSISISDNSFNIPNVVEVVYSNNGMLYTAVAKNENKNSKYSIQSRGREIIYRESNPSGINDEFHLNEYAEGLLKNLSRNKRTISYTHAYVPNVNIGDCVEIDYPEVGLNHVRAIVQTQEISLNVTGEVRETAVYYEE